MKKVNCDAFFEVPDALNYYNEKLYVLSNDWSKIDKVHSIYEVELDGSSRKAIYSTGNDLKAFCIHRGEGYVYEKKYTDEGGNVSERPILTITKFPMKNPQKTEIIFSTDDCIDGEINYLNFYQDYCYFTVVDFLKNDIVASGKKIHLKTGEVSNSVNEREGYIIGKDRILSIETLEEDYLNSTWKSAYYQCDLEGRRQKQLTEKDFEIIGRGVPLRFIDDKFVYFVDIDYGANEVPREERKIYVYTYEGEAVGEIENGVLMYPEYYVGNDKYFFIYDTKEDESGNSEIMYYYIDKGKIGKDAKIELLISGDFQEYAGNVTYSIK